MTLPVPGFPPCENFRRAGYRFTSLPALQAPWSSKTALRPSLLPRPELALQ
jgi:hypothetical protein